MNRLKEIRKEKNISQEELAQTFKITQQAISAYENGSRDPDSEMLVKLADYFNVSTDYLLGRTDIKKPADLIQDAIKDDPELGAFWDEMKERESLQLLFKQAKKLDDKDIKQIIRIIKAIEDEEANE